MASAASAEFTVDDAAANAPEIDNARLAPEYRGDNVPPQVSIIE